MAFELGACKQARDSCESSIRTNDQKATTHQLPGQLVASQRFDDSEMICRIALTVSIVVAGAAPALAQNHPRSQVRSYPHGPDHVRPDSVTHAAMHAALHGNWTGTLSDGHGVSSELDMSITHDSLRNVTVTLRANREIAAGHGRDFVVRGNQLQWTQDVAGTLCKVTAVMSTATPVAHDTMNGRMACEGSELTFSLRKKT